MGGKKFIVLILIVMVSGFMGGAFSDHIFNKGAQANNKSSNAVNARAFNLVDKNGKPRASLGFSEEGYPTLLFSNTSGKVVAYFGVGAESKPMIGFDDKQGKTRLTMALDNDDGTPAIFFYDGFKKPKMGIAVGRNGEPGIILYDKESIPRMAVAVQDKSPRIAFMEGKKNLDLLISTEENGNSGMIIQNKHGKVALGLINQNPALMLNKTPDTGLISGFAPDGTPLVALRENRQVTWVAPQGKKSAVEEINPAANWQSITDSLLKQPQF